MDPNDMVDNVRYKGIYRCNIPQDCCGNIISWKRHATTRVAIPSNSRPNPTPSTGRGTTQAGGKWSNYGGDPNLFIGGSGFICRRRGRTTCGGITGGFAPNPIRHWRKQLFPRQGGCTGKSRVSVIQDRPGSAIILTDNSGMDFSGNYTEFYINQSSLLASCEKLDDFCFISNIKKRSRAIPSYTRDYHSSSLTYLQSRGKLYRQKNAVNFKKYVSFSSPPCCTTPSISCPNPNSCPPPNYRELYSWDCENRVWAENNPDADAASQLKYRNPCLCVLPVTYDPVNAKFATNTAVASSLRTLKESQIVLTKNQFNITNKWGLDGTDSVKNYPIVKTRAPGYTKLSGGSGIKIVCCAEPEIVIPIPPYGGEGEFIFSITDSLWALSLSKVNSIDISACPITPMPDAFLFSGYPIVDPNYTATRTKVTVKGSWYLAITDPDNYGFSMNYITSILGAGETSLSVQYDINILQWGGIYFAAGGLNCSTDPTPLCPYNCAPSVIWTGQNLALTEDIPNINSSASFFSCFYYSSNGGNSFPVVNYGNINKWGLSNITNMSRAFQGSTYFDTDIGNWNVSNIEYFSYAFSETQYTGIGIESWIPSAAIDMSNMFYYCQQLTEDLSSWAPYVGLVETFENCFVRHQGNGIMFEQWNVESCKNFTKMFYECPNFIPNLINWNVSSGEDFTSTFAKGNAVESKFQGNGLIPWVTSSALTFENMFNNANKFNQDLSSWDITNLTGGSIGNLSTSAAGMFDDTIMSLMHMTDVLAAWGQETTPNNYIILGISGQTFYEDKYQIYDLSNNYNWDICGGIPSHVVPQYLEGLTDWHNAYFGGVGNALYPRITGDIIVSASDFTLWAQDASIVTNFNNMFNDCTDFTGIGLPLWNTVSATNMGEMFAGCENFNQDLSSWNVTGLIDLNNLFSYCLIFEGAGLSSWNVQNAVNMLETFYSNYLLNENLGSWNVINVENFVGTFWDCSSYQGIGLENWNISTAINMNHMFLGCTNFNGIIGGWRPTSASTLSTMFTNCSSFNQDLSAWPIQSFQNCGRTFDYTGMSVMNYTRLLIGWGAQSGLNSDVSLGAWPLTYYYIATPFRQSLIDNFNWDISDAGVEASGNVPIIPPAIASSTNWSRMFPESLGLNGYNGPPVRADYIDISEVVVSTYTNFTGYIWDPSMVTNLFEMFIDCSNWTGTAEFHEDGLYNWNTRSAINMGGMLQGCSIFDTDLSGWNVGNVTNFANMFKDCSAFTGYGIGTWNTSSATDMSGMFSGCTSFNEDLSGWDISNITPGNSMSTALAHMFDDTSMTLLNMTSTLDGWGKQTHIPTEVIVGLSGCPYYMDKYGVINLQNTGLWDISDGDPTHVVPQFLQGYTSWSNAYNDNSGASTFPVITGDSIVPETDFSLWATDASLVTSFYYTFSLCSNLVGIGLPLWDMTNAVTISQMFNSCTTLQQDLSAWNVENVTNFSSTFNGCTIYDGSGIDSWNTSDGTNMNNMFKNCTNFNRDINSFNTENVINMSGMFDGCIIFNQDISSWNTSNVTNMSSEFSGCTSFNIDLSGWNIESLTNGANMFDNTNLSVINFTSLLVGWGEQAPTNTPTLGAANITYYQDKYAVNNLANTYGWTIGGIKTSVVPRYLIGLTDWSGVYTDGSGSDSYYNVSGDSIVAASDFTLWASDASAITDLSGMFYNCTNFVGLGLPIWDISDAENLEQMFLFCENFNQDLSSWTVSDISNLYLTFGGCTNFNQDISWNTQNVTNMNGTFWRCTNLNSDICLNLLSCNTTNQMFAECSIFNKNIGDWNVSSVTDFNGMFNNCSTYTGEGIGIWNTSNITDMDNMFNRTNFNQDISSWNISSLTDASGMLNDTSFSAQNYSLLLLGWTEQAPAIQSSVTFGVSGDQYYQWATAAHNILSNTYLWTINDDGLNTAQIGFPPSIALLTDWSFMFDGGKGSITDANYVDVSGYVITSVSDFTIWKAENVTNLDSMFNNCTNFGGIGLSTWNTSSATNMDYLLQNCTNLNQDLSEWNISSLTDASGMLDNTGISEQNYTDLLKGWAAQAPLIQSNVIFGASNLKYYPTAGSAHDVLTITYNWTITDAGATSFVMPASIGALTDWSFMFEDGTGSTTNTAYVDVSGYVLSATTNFALWTPNNVLYLEGMFMNANIFQGDGLSLWNIASCKSLNRMFDGCSAFNQDLSGWNTQYVRTSGMYRTFKDCNVFEGTGLDTWDTTRVTNMDSMFENCYVFNQDLSNWNIYQVSIMYNTFKNCTSFIGTGLSVWSTSSISTANTMLSGATNFNEDISGWNISSLTAAVSMLDNCGMSPQYYSHLLLSWSASGQARNNVTFGASGVKYYWWAQSGKDILDTSYNWTITDGGIYNDDIVGQPPSIKALTDWSYMFDGGVGNTTDPSFTDISDVTITAASDFSYWTTGNVIKAGYMFNNCPTFVGIGLSKWNWGSTTDMSGILKDCTNFNQDLSAWITTNNQDFSEMFKSCTNFTGEGLKYWTTNSATNMADMFNGNIVFNEDISQWHTTNVTNMDNMLDTATIFDQDISGWNISSLTSAANMLDDCSMSAQHYSVLLISWADQAPSIQNSVVFGASGVKYYSWAQNARDTLTSTYLWTITDGGLYTGTTIGFPPSIAALTDWSYMFKGGIGSITDPSYVDISGIDITAASDFTLWKSDSVKNLYEMFRQCSTFVGLGLSLWNTQDASNISNMFYQASAFNEDISGWNTGNVTNMSQTFIVASAFDKPLNWNTSLVTNMWGMFGFCGLFNQDIGSWNTQNVTSMGYMFYGTQAFNQDLNWNTINVVDMGNMFRQALVFNGNINSWNTVNVELMYQMFQEAPEFNQNISAWNTGNVTNMYSMFQEATAFNQNIGGWNTENVGGMYNVFDGATAFNQDIGAWNVSSVTLVTSMLDDCGMSTENYTKLLVDWGAQSGLNTGLTLGASGLTYANYVPGVLDLSTNYSWTIGGTGTDVFYFPASIEALTDWNNMFSGSIGSITNTNYIDVSGWVISASSDFSLWDASSVTDLSGMFYQCSTFTGTGLSSFGVKDASNLEFMFSGCSAFNEDLNSWSTSNVTTLEETFINCTVYNGDGVQNWNTSNVIDISGMFTECNNFNQDLSGWDVKKVVKFNTAFKSCNIFTGNGLQYWRPMAATWFSSMLSECVLFNQDLSGWDTDVSAAKYFSNMFNSCTSYDGEGVQYWQTFNARNFSSMFEGSIFNQDLSGWNISLLTNATGMLNDCSLNTNNYTNLLIGWGDQAPSIQSSVTLDASGVKYYETALDERNILIGAPYLWTINDGGMDVIVPFPPSIAALTDWEDMFMGGIGSITIPAFIDVSGIVLTQYSDFVLWDSSSVTIF